MFPVLSVLIILVASVSCGSFSRFEKTNIIDYKCDKSWFLKTVPSRSIINCGLKCNEVKDCKRFLFCGGKSECKLYGDGTDCIIDGDAAGCRCYKKIIGCNGLNCICPWGFYGDNCQHIVIDCHDAFLKGIQIARDVVTRIKPNIAQEAFDVICRLTAPPYLTILHRLEKCWGGNFNRTLHEYEQGFGIVPWNHWLGFEKILYILNNPRSFSLLVHLSNSQWDSCTIFYENFTMGNASTKYEFQTASEHYSDYRPTCGDSMTGSNNTLDLRGRPFSTYDQDETSANCAASFGGGWWFADHPNCTDSCLTATIKSANKWSDTFWEPDMKKLTMKLVSDII